MATARAHDTSPCVKSRASISIRFDKAVPSPLRLRLVAAAVLMMMATIISAQETVCTDPADKACFDCMHQIAGYTSGMVLPSESAAPAKLQSAVDNAFKDVQLEWTGPVGRRKYLRAAYFTGAAAILLFVIGLAVIRRIASPKLYVNRPPTWNTETALLVALTLLLCVGLVGERWWTYTTMVRDYEQLAAAVRPVVHLIPPAQLANGETEPCRMFWSSTDALLARCDEEWSRGAKRPSRYKETHFTDPDLLRATLAVGTACRRAELPFWWLNSAADPARHAIGSECVIAQNEADIVTFRDIASLPSLAAWISGTGRLELEPLFRRRNVAGGNIYQEKVAYLLGNDGFRVHRDNYVRKSVILAGVPVLLLFALQQLFRTGRKRELAGGSRAWAHIQRNVLRWSGGVALLTIFLVAVAVLLK